MRVITSDYPRRLAMYLIEVICKLLRSEFLERGELPCPFYPACWNERFRKRDRFIVCWLCHEISRYTYADSHRHGTAWIHETYLWRFVKIKNKNDEFVDKMPTICLFSCAKKIFINFMPFYARRYVVSFCSTRKIQYFLLTHLFNPP